MAIRIGADGFAAMQMVGRLRGAPRRTAAQTDQMRVDDAEYTLVDGIVQRERISDTLRLLASVGTRCTSNFTQ